MAIGLSIISKDIVISNNGTLDLISGQDKVSRDFKKMLQTDVESPNNTTSYYRYNPLYGTELNRRELYNGLSRQSILEVINLLCNQAIKNYIALQESRDNLDIEEVITAVNYHTVYDNYTPSLIRFNVTLTLANGEIIVLPTFGQQVV